MHHSPRNPTGQVWGGAVGEMVLGGPHRLASEGRRLTDRGSHEPTHQEHTFCAVSVVPCVLPLLARTREWTRRAPWPFAGDLRKFEPPTSTNKSPKWKL